MKNYQILVRLRIIIIKNGKLLVQYRQNKDFYHYVGGHLEHGETILAGCQREIAEECAGAAFEFKKILYISDFFEKSKNEHSVELFILGDIDKTDELEHLMDPEHPDNSVWATWLDLNSLPDNLLPHKLTAQLLADYQNNFSTSGTYVGDMT